MKLAVDMCGAGVRGAAWTIGAYQQLNEFLGYQLDEAGFYGGRSSGTVIAALLANKVDVSRVARALREEGLPEENFTRNILFGGGKRPKESEGLRSRIRKGISEGIRDIEWEDLGEDFNERIKRMAPSHLIESARDYVNGGWSEKFKEAVAKSLSKDGLFSNYGLDAYMARNLEMYEGATNKFSELEKELVIGVTEVQTGMEKILDNSSRVKISKAVATSCAFPVLFKPIEIRGKKYHDGCMSSTTNVHIAFERGYDLAIVINPARPMKSYGRMITNVIDVAEQVGRTLLRTKTINELNVMREAYPDKGIILIEPDEADTFTSTGAFKVNKEDNARAIRHGRERVRGIFKENWKYLSDYFSGHGFKVNTSVLSNPAYFSTERLEYKHTEDKGLERVIIA